jgi:FkbM family methyltransferase
MSYLDKLFTDNIKKDLVKIIFELGSRDLQDAILLKNYYKANVYAFECNPDCLVECNKTMMTLNESDKSQIHFINKAVSLDNGDITFYPFDLTKYNNMGSSSLLKIDFSMRNISDPDYNRPNPQGEITVEGQRLDTFIIDNNISNIDLLCIDLQGYELNAIKSLGDKINKVKYIITECSIQNTYINGATFVELYEYLQQNGFTYICSNKFGNNFPNTTLTGFSEFDALFINKSAL